MIEAFNPTSIAGGIAARVKARRIALNITQKELSVRTGVSLGSIKRFETKHQIALQSLIQISLVLNASAEFQQLFPLDKYKSIAEVLSVTQQKTRKRARHA